MNAEKAASGGTSTESRMADQLSTTNQPRTVYHRQAESASVFDTIKDALTMADVVRFYGYEPNHAGFICCPFHSEKTPSMKVYERNYHCFGCGDHGSVIDFTAKLLGVDPLGAVKRLNDDFNLRLSLDSAPDPKRLQERKQIAHAKQLFEEWKTEMLRQFDAVIRLANLADYACVSDSETMALQYREACEYWSDVLMHGNIEAQMEILRDRQGVEAVCRMILKHTLPRLNVS